MQLSYLAMALSAFTMRALAADGLSDTSNPFLSRSSKNSMNCSASA